MLDFSSLERDTFAMTSEPQEEEVELDPEDQGGPDFDDDPEEDYPEGEAEPGDVGEPDEPEDADIDVSDIEEADDEEEAK